MSALFDSLIGYFAHPFYIPLITTQLAIYKGSPVLFSAVLDRGIAPQNIVTFADLEIQADVEAGEHEVFLLSLRMLGFYILLTDC